MTKLQRLQLNQEKALLLQSRSDEINELINLSRNSVSWYWQYVKECWAKGKMTSCTEVIPDYIKNSMGFRGFNQQARLLLKTI